jgi:O-antigen ligase
VYLGGKLGAGELLTIWPAEMCALALIVVIGIVITPVAASPQHSIDMLSDTFFKVVVIFILMINLVDTRKRLLRILKLVVICGAGIAAGSIWKFAEGKFTATIQGVGVRIEGAVGGIFGNPNDLAMALDMLLPLSIVLMLNSKSAERLLFLLCTFLLTMGVVVSFSRGGFLGLAAACGVLLWKLGRHNKFTTALAVMGACSILALSMPAGYADRLFTIVHTDKDTTGSAKERQDELKRVTFLAVRHPVIGIGLNNYPVYSNHAIRAHNSFLEVAAELGVLGLIAYLILILAPLKRLKRIERETSLTGDPVSRELHFLGAGVQAAILGYVVCAVFSSAQYQWYLYYPVAYAVALKRIHDATRPVEQKSSAKPKRRLNLGRLWGRGVGAEA